MLPSVAVRLLGLEVQIPSRAWMFNVNVVYCEVEVSATDRSLVQRSPTEGVIASLNLISCNSNPLHLQWGVQEVSLKTKEKDDVACGPNKITWCRACVGHPWPIPTVLSFRRISLQRRTETDWILTEKAQKSKDAWHITICATELFNLLKLTGYWAYQLHQY